MLFRAHLLVAAAALLAHQASAQSVTCNSGYYIDASLNCQKCPDGSINANSVTSSHATSCTPCPAGGGSNPGHTSCTTCTAGKYATGGTVCMSCPAGQTSTSNHQGCQKCAAGTANPSAGGTCQDCPKGSFNNVVGAKSCCDCCAGWYSESTGSISCDQCPSPRKYSAVRSDNNSDCKQNPGSGLNKLPNYTTSCSMVADNVCPNPTGDGPQGTAISRKRRNVQCTKGFEACPRFSGQGGFDCIDTENNPEACGGCRSLDGQGSGTDCTAIKGVSVTRCVKMSCVIDSCRKGWVKSLDGTSCVSASHPTGSSDGLLVQDTDAKKRRSSAKRARIRANIY
ncbi:hypothetical protein FRC04_002774 [Tulasnella sp. 424]|nr:hypothetical protein FRC04_002774 [Tulasnella sp. 424]KAG8964077.1 hypothetical protein FRC05_004304 [Tulasnella sp. 425]